MYFTVVCYFVSNFKTGHILQQENVGKKLRKNVLYVDHHR